MQYGFSFLLLQLVTILVLVFLVSMHLSLIHYQTLHPVNLHSFYLNASEVYQSLEHSFPRAFLFQYAQDASSSSAQ